MTLIRLCLLDRFGLAIKAPTPPLLPLGLQRLLAFLARLHKQGWTTSPKGIGVDESTAVLVVPDGTKEVVREDWEMEGRDASHVDYVTEDLTGFLAQIARK